MAVTITGASGNKWTYDSSTGNLTPPSGVTAIPDNEFKSNTTLVKVVIASTIKSIGAFAFSGCTNMTNMTIPSSVTTIANNVFSACSKLSKLIIPSSVTSMGVQCFYNATLLTTAGPTGSGCTIEYGWTTEIPENGLNNANKLATIKFPTTLTKIGASAFCGTAFTSFTIPSTVTTMGNNVFGGCQSLSKVIIPKSVTSIGYECFYNCTLLKTAGPTGSGCNIEYGWDTEIPANAFNYAASLTSITFPTTLKIIKELAFRYCSGLTTVKLPDNLVEIWHGAFQYCTGLTKVTIPKSVTTMTKYTGDSYYGVFQNCTSLTTAGPIGSGCNIEYAWSDEIPTKAFAADKTLTSITLPNTIRVIKIYAFMNCISITNMTIPEGVKTLDAFIFCNCSALTKVTVPKSVTLLGTNSDISPAMVGGTCFYNCVNLKTVGPKGGGYNIEYAWDVEIPDSAFYLCDTITDVSIANGITKIGPKAFYKCLALVNVSLPKSLTTIETSAFWNCSSLKNITLPSSITVIKDNMFNACSALSSVTIPEGVTSIGYNVFSGCSSLTSLKLPESLEFIDVGAFTSCTNLSKINIPKNVRQITTADLESTSTGSGLFKDCTKLTTAGPTGSGCNIEFGWTEEIPDHAFRYHNYLTSITLPNTLKRIGIYSFYYCTALTNIKLPDSLEEIAHGAFTSCTSLSKIVIPKSCTKMTTSVEEATSFTGIFASCTKLLTAGPIGSGCDIEFGWDESIPERALFADKTLTKVTLPNTIKSIGRTAFAHLINLSSIIIPKSVVNMDYNVFYNSTNIQTAGPIGSGCNYQFEWDEKIPKYAFASVSCLRKVTIPKTITTLESYSLYSPDLTTAGPIGSGCDIEFAWDKKIPDKAFCECSNFTTINIPEGITEIGNYAFYYCNKLTKITIPKSVTIMGNDCFYNASLLLTAGPIGGGYNIEFGWTDQIPDNAFSDSKITAIKLPNTLTKIGAEAFYGTDITTINIPKGVTSIGEYAFESCYSLNNVITPDTLTFIGAGAFELCYNLTSITIPKGITSIKERTFYGCSNLSNITIPEGVTTIGGAAFWSCANITEIILPSTVTDIGLNAFVMCGSLEHLVIPKNATNMCTQYYNAMFPTLGVFGACYNLLTAGPIGSGCAIEFGWDNEIPEAAFYGAGCLESITIPKTIESIGRVAFSDCRSLKNLLFEGSPHKWNILNRTRSVTIDPSSYGQTDQEGFDEETTPMIDDLITLMNSYLSTRNGG